MELMYKSDIAVMPGDVVLVPLRKKEIIGVVCNVLKKTDLYEASFEVRNIIQIINSIHIEKKTRNFIDWVANYNITGRGIILKMVLGPFVSRHNRITRLIEKSEKLTTIQDKVDTSQEVYNTLSPSQYAIYKSIVSSLYEYSVNVIDGITGSGKTELYLKIAHFVLSTGGQVLILLPEILLSTQITQRIRAILGKEYTVHNWHSNAKQSERDKIWLGVQTMNVKIVVGARSALFLPFARLQCIIVDEEHDSSFKQESFPTYDAKNMAIVRAKICDIPIVLVSATPSIETIYNIRAGNYRYFHLDQKFFTTNNTSVVVANMWDMKSSNGSKSNVYDIPLLHDVTIQYISEALAQNTQILLFLNRKGYASTVFCNACLTKVKCTSCDVRLTYYKHSNILRCRYCKGVIPQHNVCKICGAKDSLCAYHYGIEKLETEVKKRFNNARVISVTSDSIGSKGDDIESIIKQIADHEVDIIIGTQVLAKGLHFQDIALCVIVDASSVGFNSDIRALERTHQILHQVMGRVGRETKQGTAILQTFNRNSPIVKAIAQNKSNEFIELELASRKQAVVPPYGKFILISISGANDKRVKKWLAETAPTIPEDSNEIQVFGPSPSPISRIKNRYRYCILFKSDRKTNLHTIVRSWISKLKVPYYVHLSVDVDPYSFY